MNIQELGYNCVDCGLCSLICPKQCIRHAQSSDGSRYPVLDGLICVNCGVCTHFCPKLNELALRAPTSYFCYTSRSEDVLEKSSSGGFGHDFCEAALEMGLSVFGARFDAKTKKVVHEEMTLENLNDFSRSKYTKGVCDGKYRGIEQALATGKSVVAVGLPCENAAVKLRFPKECRDRIILVDLFCGGAVDGIFFDMYIRDLEKRYSKKVVDIDFRDKRYGAKLMCTKVYFSDGSSRYLNGFQNYYILLQGSQFVRRACLSCAMGFLDSQSDLRIGDYFGKGDRGAGKTLVFNYSDKAVLQSVLERILNKGKVFEVKERPEDIVRCRSKGAKKAIDPSIEDDRVSFYSLAKRKGLKKAVRRYVYGSLTFKQKAFFHIPYRLKKWCLNEK